VCRQCACQGCHGPAAFGTVTSVLPQRQAKRGYPQRQHGEQGHPETRSAASSARGRATGGAGAGLGPCSPLRNSHAPNLPRSSVLRWRFRRSTWRACHRRSRCTTRRQRVPRRRLTLAGHTWCTGRGRYPRRRRPSSTERTRATRSCGRSSTRGQRLRASPRTRCPGPKAPAGLAAPFGGALQHTPRCRRVGI